MRQLTLEDLAPYLPYGLEFTKFKALMDLRLISVGIDGYTLQEYNRDADWINLRFDYDGTKPILRPLSDLTKLITVEGYNDGKEFVPIDEIQKLSPQREFSRAIDYVPKSGMWMLNTNRDGEVAINVMRRIDQFLHKWHFDTRNLIDAGLAIDINTLS